MLEGMIKDGVHILKMRVHYEDTDFSGLVYHANYLKFCERARSDYLRVAGIDQNTMASDGSAFVVRRMVCDFRKPARFDDVVEVQSWATEVSGARILLAQRVKRIETSIFEAVVTVAMIAKSGKPMRIGAEMAAKFPVVTLS